MDPLGALRQELEVWVGVDVQDVDQLGLQQRADVHPLLVNLLHSVQENVPKTKTKYYQVPFSSIGRPRNTYRYV